MKTATKKALRQQTASAARQITWPFARATAAWRRLPDFVIVGAQRCGTTSLYRYLLRHPDVGGVRLGKGVHYFDTNAGEPLRWYQAHFPIDRQRIPAGRGPRLVGESSPYYMFHPAVPARLRAAAPDVKVIAVLRDPVERAHSQWVHETARGYETLGLMDALEAESLRLVGQEERLLADPRATSFSHQHHSYLARSQYAGQIERLWSTFGRDQVLVVPAAQLFEQPDVAWSKTLDFLGLAPFDIPFTVHNAHSYDALEPEAREFLESRLADSNQRLVEMLGPDFDFSRHG